MKIFITKITPLHPTSVFLQWMLEDVTESGVFVFSVYRSGSPGGPWTKIVDPLNDTYSYNDPLNQESANTLSVARDIYYYVRCVPPSGVSNAIVSPIVNLDGLTEYTVTGPDTAIGYVVDAEGQYEPGRETDIFQRPPTATGRKRLYKRAIQRHLYIGLRALFGTEFYLLKRRHFGRRCTECYDVNTREVLQAGCPTCYGTSWDGGYFTAISLLGKRLASVVQSGITDHSKDDVNVTQIQFLDFPRIDEGDLLVERHANRRWLVKARVETSLKGIIVEQVVSVSEIGRGEPEYSIPVTLP